MNLSMLGKTQIGSNWGAGEAVEESINPPGFTVDSAADLGKDTGPILREQIPTQRSGADLFKFAD